MSEESATPTAGVVESAGTDVTTSVETVETSGNVEEGRTDPKTFQGRDRVGEAIKKARKEIEGFKLPEKVEVESLSTVEGLDEGGHKGIDYNRVISELPDDAKNLLSNLRADYTRKTQELAAQRKEIEMMRDSLLNDGANTKIQELAQKETVELDPYDTDSFNSRIEQEVARRLNEMLQPMREEQYQMKRRNQLEKFKSENPDMMDYRNEIASLLKSNESLTLQDAYHIVKGQKLTEVNKTLQAELDTRTKRMREVGLKLSQGTSTQRDKLSVPKHLKKGHEIYAWIESQKNSAKK